MPITTVRRALRRARYGKPIIVVSGLPRSGTSMMMQMLTAGGIEPMIDDVRTADESNPRGYYELERVKDLETAADKVWLRDARGRTVKIISFLMRFLPETFNYKVVFMHRRLDEVLASQTKMLAKLGETTETEDARMRELFTDNLARTRSQLAYRPCFDVLHVKYSDVIEDGRKHADALNRFLGGHLDAEAMAAAVNPQLYRNRH